MKIVCESCGAKYSIADEKVAGKVFKIRCKKCSAVIVVKGDQPQEGAESTRVFDYGGEAVWHVVVSGEQQGPFAPRQIGELLSEGKIDWEAYVWREGMDGWQPAKDVEALVKAVMAEADGGEGAAAASGSSASGDVFGGSSDMGADPFASSDDGGLSGVIGQSSAHAAPSAMAAGGGADLFADAGRPAFGGADDDDDARPAGPTSGPKVTEGQALTGQRNENSVLFSLSNLQALATGSGAAPAAGRAKPGMAQGEGSGLIDIRALASATQGTGERSHAGSREKVEDLLAVGSTGTTFSATSLAAPVAVEKPNQGRPVLYIMAAAILALGGAVTFLAIRDPAPQPTAQLTPTQESAPTPAAQPGATAAPAPTAAAPQAAEPSPEPAAAAPDPTPAEEKPAEREKDDDSHEARAERRRRASEGSTSKSGSEKSEPDAPVAEAPAKKTGGSDSIDDLLSGALGGKPKPASKPAASDNLQPTLTREDVLSAMKGVTPGVQNCGGGQSGVAIAKLTVAGPTGKVSSVDVGGQFAGTPVASCVAKEVKKAKFPKFSQPTFSVTYPFKI